jgi:hypothetical protein
MEKMTLKTVFTMLCNKLEDKPDSYTISIGDWRQMRGFPIPEFSAIYQLELGEIREMVEWKKEGTNG